MRNLYFLLFISVLPLLCRAQIERSQTNISVEFQAYPTGLVPGVRIAKLFKEQHALHFRLGYNWIRHRDLGVHEDERGDGFGFTLGYRQYFSPNHEKYFVGVRSDFWFNELIWKDNIGGGNEITGVSNIRVIQPTLEAGHLFLLSDGSTFVSPSVAFGFEVNIKTEGEEVGQGAILLVGLSLGKRF